MTDRRLLMKMLGAAAMLGIPRRASAENAKSFTIAYLALLPNEDRTFVPNFLHRLDQLGYVDGHNLHFVYRCAEGRADLLPDLASQLIAIRPDVLVTGFGTVPAKVAKATTDSIPVVFMAVGDPVGAGIVASLARPGGNVTGLSDLAAGLQGNRLQLLCEMAPRASIIAAVYNPATPYAAIAYKELEAASHIAAVSQIAKVEIRSFEVHTPDDIAPQLEASKAAGAGGLVVFEDPLTLSQRSEIAALASRLRLPAIYGYREFTLAGGLMSFGTDHSAQWRRGAEIVDIVLKGTRPADIPVEQPTKFELVVNLETAEASNFTVPQTIMLSADEIIE